MVLFLSLDFCINTKIHILEQPLNLRKESIQRSKEKNANSNNDSQISKICNSILNTYAFLGQKSLNIYQGCREDYELLGMLDSDIIKNRPFCFDSPNQFFCNYKIDSHQNESCEKEDLIQLVLSIIRGCLNVN